MRGVRRFTDLRAWQACDVYKKAVYKLLEKGVFRKDWQRLNQLEDAVAGPPGHIAEGFGQLAETALLLSAKRPNRELRTRNLNRT